MNKIINTQEFETSQGSGSRTGIDWARVLQGLITSLAVLAAVAFWGTFIYAMVSGNVKLAMIFGQIIAIMVGIFVPAHLLYKLYQHLTRL